jgi:hypothetical protein
MLRRSLACLLLAAACAASAEEAAMQADRPSLTAGPYAVPAGHVQLEADLARATGLASGPARLRGGDFTLRLGLPGQSDAEWSYQAPLSHSFRFKMNPWQGENWSAGLVSGIVLGEGKAAQVGLILPLDLSLPAGWDLGAMLEADLILDDPDPGLRPLWTQSLLLGRALFGPLSGYAEWLHQSQAAGGSEAQAFGCGLALALGGHALLDASFEAQLAPLNGAEAALGLSLRY